MNKIKFVKYIYLLNFLYRYSIHISHNHQQIQIQMAYLFISTIITTNNFFIIILSKYKKLS